MLSRRRITSSFVRHALRSCRLMSAVAEVSPCGPCLPDFLSVEPCCPQPKVVIVGAGIAGLSAAQRLADCGLTDLTLLEALPRPGGRINTLVIDGTPFDLGASSIFGCCPGNAVFTLACQEKVIKNPLTRINYNNGVCCSFGGRPVKSAVFQASTRLFAELMQEARRNAVRPPFSLNVWSFLEKGIENVCKYFPENDKEIAKSVMYSMANSVSFGLGSELWNVPLSKFGLKKRIPGGDIAVDGGMSSVLKPLLRTISPSKIKFKKIVRKIYWDPRSSTGHLRATIVTCDKEVYDADYVISTIPLGVLKCSHGDLFEPPLPERKLNAIRRIGLGHLNSVCMKYEKPFWVKGEGSIRTCWPVDVLKKGELWTHGVGLIQEVQNAADLLKVTVSGNAAKLLETLPNQQIINDITMMTRCFLGDPTLPPPSHVIRSNWTSDPQFGGGTSYLGADSSELDQRELGGPLPNDEVAPTLFFAGEATITGHHGTLHGARLSGVREAERILKLTRCFCGPPPKPPRATCTF